MDIQNNNGSKDFKRNLIREFTRLMLTFLLCLFLLSIYQNLRLYGAGVLDSFINKSTFLLWLHHTGFTALLALVLVFPLHIVARKKPVVGLKLTRFIIIVLLLSEVFLVEFYVQNYIIFGISFFNKPNINSLFLQVLPVLIVAFPVMILAFIQFHKIIASSYRLISRMYPFTIVLFSLFLATLLSVKKPINQNKTQYVMETSFGYVFNFSSYEGKEEYPLLRIQDTTDYMGHKFNFKEQPPNIVFIIIEGLGADFIGENASFKSFTPFLNTLADKSLYWENFLSNSAESNAVLPTVVGSLPFGNKGFNSLTSSPDRNTLYGILKNNGYFTTYNYGGNTALNQIDRFLAEERVDDIVDRNSFNFSYTLQDADGAGISLGYPDDALFKKWITDLTYKTAPRFDVFQTLSTQKPFLIPERDTYLTEVTRVLKRENFEKSSHRFIKKNKALFASYIYTDTALKKFFLGYQVRPEFYNTIFVVLGSHNSLSLPQKNALDPYRVPLMVYSPLMGTPQKVSSLASQVDIVPTLLQLLSKRFPMTLPSKVAWLGNAMQTTSHFESNKVVPLFRSGGNINDFIKGDTFYSAGDVFTMDRNLKLHPRRDRNTNQELIEEQFTTFKTINDYVTQNNKLIPKELVIYPKNKTHFSKQETIWINSVFSGNNFDNAYQIARSLAFDKKREKALLLCNYILTNVPRHTDTEILMGRIYAWDGNYDNARDILKNVIQKYPNYADAYAALLDVYFWSDQNEEVIKLVDQIEKLKIEDDEVAKRVSRAFKKVTERNEMRRWEQKETQLTTLEFDEGL